MPALEFSTGLVSYELPGVNGPVSITFNPTDAAFMERLYNTFEALDKADEQRKAELEKVKGTREIFDMARKWDKEMRSMVDEAMGAPVSETLFGGMNVYALGDGLPVWANLLLTVMDEIDATFVREQAQSGSRIQKYTAKYRKK